MASSLVMRLGYTIINHKGNEQHARESPILSCHKKFKTQTSVERLIMTEFWDTQSPILQHYHERGTTELRPAIHTK
jgi:hypothetical protein